MARPATHLACPSAFVEAPIAVVWDLLTATAEWGSFYDIRILSVDPPGPARPGQRLVGVSGPRFLPLRVVFDFTEVDAARHNIRMQGRLPFGLKVSENLIVTPIGPERCRVNYNCDFGLPDGLRGRLVWWLLRREFDRGPADSLERLKGEAERRAAAQSASGTVPRAHLS